MLSGATKALRAGPALLAVCVARHTRQQAERRHAFLEMRWRSDRGSDRRIHRLFCRGDGSLRRCWSTCLEQRDRRGCCEVGGAFHPCGIVIGIIVPIAEDAKRRQEAESAEEARRQRQIAEQLGYQNEMVALGEQSLVLFESMPNFIRSAEENLDQAEIEFADGAFAPFWDCIESVAKTLGRFDEGVHRIKNNSRRYAELIKKNGHTPSRFPLAPQSVTGLNVAVATAERMKAIVRKAQCDFQFATIYEQRKTNQLLVAGFTNLAHALREMTWQITSSIDDLARSIDGITLTIGESLQDIHSRIGDIAKATDRHVEEASKVSSAAAERERKALEILDNIQRRKRPFR
jgi:uncharacterized protein YfcZ (UPF0381/DUF406 family)